MNEASIFGLRNIKTDEKFDPNNEYLVSVVCALTEIAHPCTFEDSGKDTVKYKLKADRIESVIDLKERKEIEFEHGKTPSQKMRWVIEQNLGKDEYDSFMKWLLPLIDSLCYDFKERNQVFDYKK